MKQDAKEHHLSINERNCIVIRMSEKEILINTIKMIETLLPLMEDDLDLKTVQLKMKQINNPIVHQYWDKALLPLIKATIANKKLNKQD
mgnify:CR=1 FL=1|jgi:hypothetical protein